MVDIAKCPYCKESFDAEQIIQSDTGDALVYLCPKCQTILGFVYSH
ncbi:MAG: DUF3268 family zinc-finger domain-containing protein [Candidatus Thermoplasmatota archaeon]|nr:DUF3268 family zinc-finger domain-containing protein [Candidatus Thermoplasmatota archaeon]